MPLNYKDLQETVTLPNRITPTQFGVSEEIFNRSVRGQRLKIAYQTGTYIYVEVEGEVGLFSIHQDDLVPDRESKDAAYGFTKNNN